MISGVIPYYTVLAVIPHVVIGPYTHPSPGGLVYLAFHLARPKTIGSLPTEFEDSPKCANCLTKTVSQRSETAVL